MEYSLFMIKPIAYEHKQEILDIIKKKLQIVSTADVCLSEEFLNKLYASETDEEFRKINSRCLANKKACIGVVRGENAKTKLVEICGDKPIGEECDKESIRYIYRTNKRINISGRDFYLNAIHKSSPEDADYEVALYIREILGKDLKSQTKKKQKQLYYDDNER